MCFGGGNGYGTELMTILMLRIQTHTHMQTLATFLRALANINLILQEMQNRQVAYAVSNQMKHAANMCGKDYRDVAHIVDEGLEYADDLCEQDVIRLQRVSKSLREANQLLHRVQDTIIANNLSFPEPGE